MGLALCLANRFFQFLSSLDNLNKHQGSVTLSRALQPRNLLPKRARRISTVTHSGHFFSFVAVPLFVLLNCLNTNIDFNIFSECAET